MGVVGVFVGEDVGTADGVLLWVIVVRKFEEGGRCENRLD